MEAALSCTICFDTFDTTLHRPLNLECGHVFCKECLVSGRLRVCPSCRHPTSKPVDQLIPNWGLLQVIDAQASLPDTPQPQRSDIDGIVEMLGRLGLQGIRRFVLEPSSVQLIRVISTVGATGEVWEGRLDGHVEVRTEEATRITGACMVGRKRAWLHASQHGCMHGTPHNYMGAW